jgi:hypothetical protein
MRTINIKRHTGASKYGGFWESLGFGTSITPNNLRWNISAGDHDDNGESLRIVMNEVHAYWAAEDPTSSTAWWEGSDTNYPNTVTGADTNNWPWTSVEKQLTRIQTELAKNPAAAVGTIQHFNTMMDQNAATKKFMILDPQTQAAPVNADGTVNPVASNGSDGSSTPPVTAIQRPLVIGGISVGAILLVLVGVLVYNSTKKGKTPQRMNRY